METIAATKNLSTINFKGIIYLPKLVLRTILLVGRFIVDVFSDDKTSAYLEREKFSSRTIIYSGMPGA